MRLRANAERQDTQTFGGRNGTFQTRSLRDAAPPKHITNARSKTGRYSVERRPSAYDEPISQALEIAQEF